MISHFLPFFQCFYWPAETDKNTGKLPKKAIFWQKLIIIHPTGLLVVRFLDANNSEKRNKGFK
jgi:hypothetical protein